MIKYLLVWSSIWWSQEPESSNLTWKIEINETQNKHILKKEHRLNPDFCDFLRYLEDGKPTFVQKRSQTGPFSGCILLYKLNLSLFGK